ncbi:TetR/AcrR family transcriptional regulator [Nocardioides sp. InS609-2]|uniref:TetR/AcrR family transcriptional regulator n=1 Tax=Nocardioides sp. InS609-2 TaxID=2760705 RepID=UPI0020BFF562|nr:TetR/AcrR family transcriptional regulator [Nocardioides sp. InS609-2]
MTGTVETRAYDTSSRRARAQERRTRVLDVAWEQFRSQGYAATTVGAVARAAGVSEQTIYKTYGGKAGLVRHLRLRALEGDEHSEPAERRSDRLRSNPDPRRIVAGWARLASEVAPRVSPILLLVRDAALTDPGLQGLAVEVDDERRRRMRENAESLGRASHLRTDVSTEQATDVLFAVSSPEMFELLVIRCGWDLPRYATYVEDTLCAALLPG